MSVEGGDSEVDGESEESGGSGDGYKAMPAVLLRHFDGVGFFRHRLGLVYQTGIGREGNFGEGRK